MLVYGAPVTICQPVCVQKKQNNCQQQGCGVLVFVGLGLRLWPWKPWTLESRPKIRLRL